MTQVQTTNSFADTPKDGNWYQLPIITEELAELIRWDDAKRHWNWMMLRDDVVVIDVSTIQENNS